MKDGKDSEDRFNRTREKWRGKRHLRKWFLYRIVTGDERRILFEDLKQKKYGSAQAYHLDRKTESLCQENDALCLMGVEGVEPL